MSVEHVNKAFQRIAERAHTAPTTVQLSVEIPGSTLWLTSNLPGLEVELNKRLHPFVRITAAPPAAFDTRMFVLSSPERVSDALSGVVGSPTIIQSHRRIERYNRSGRSFHARGATLTINDQSETAVLSDPGTNSIYVLGPDERSVAPDARRLIRDLYIASSKIVGYASLHGAATAVNEKGLLICGPSSAGKSSLLLDLIKIGRQGYVSNDRVFVIYREGRFIARGAPEHVLTRMGTLGRVPEFRSLLPTKYAGLSLDALFKLPDNEKLSIQYQDLCRFFGCPIIPETPLCYTAFPVYNEPRDKPHVIRLSPEQALQKFTEADEQKLEHRTQPWHGYLRLDLEKLANTRQTIMRNLSHQLPAFLVYRGPDNLATAKELIEALAHC